MFERVLTDADATLRVSVDDRQVMIKTTQAEVSSRLVDGAFPKYESVIPKEAVLTATFKKEELLAGMRQAKLLTNEESRSVKLTFQDGKLILTSRATDVGEARSRSTRRWRARRSKSRSIPTSSSRASTRSRRTRSRSRISGKDTPSRLDGVGDEHYVYVVMPVTMRAA